MIKSNGGVFGRNPKFNNVTISGGATADRNVLIFTATYWTA